MTSKIVVITGANRGIGLEFTKQFADKGWQVFAGCRDPKAQSLAALTKDYDNVHIIKLDLNDLEACQKTLKELPTSCVDVLINNAGTSGESNQSLLNSYDVQNAHQLFHVNSIAPVKILEYLLPKMKESSDKVVVNITSRMGSITDNDSGRSYAYRSSKSALNSLMKSVQLDLASDGYKILLLHPGWVKTDMGGEQAQLTTNESVTNMMRLIMNAHDLPDLFYHCEGYTLPF